MMLYSLPCLLEEDTCRFQTIQLEFLKAKDILEMHMLHVHGRPEWRYKCNCCDRDTLVKDDKVEDIIKVEKKAICVKAEEASRNPQTVDETSHQRILIYNWENWQQLVTVYLQFQTN